MPRPDRLAPGDFSAFVRERFFKLILRVRRAAHSVQEAENPEAVHALRVALRRLRAGIRAVRPVYNSHYLRTIDASIKSIADLTSEARDIEVLLEVVENLPGLDDTLRGEIQPLLNHYRVQQTAARAQFIEELSGDALRLPLRQLRAFFMLPLKDLKKSPLQQAMKSVDLVLGPVYKDLKRIERRRSRTPWLHCLRIKCKRLRYSVDFFQDLLPEHYGELARSARIMQNRLGDLHDHDFILERLKDDRTLPWEVRKVLTRALKKQRAEILELTIQKARENRAVLARFA